MPGRSWPVSFRRGVRAFTLIEILIVVVILGILAAIVVPQISRATEEAASTATYNELQKIRRHIEVYRIRHNGNYPSVAAGDGTWGEIIGPDHLMSPPTNAWVGGATSRVIVFGTAPDGAYQTAHGWIYDPATGAVWAGSFDALDQPISR
jgi:general secretion pathway protein G